MYVFIKQSIEPLYWTMPSFFINTGAVQSPLASSNTFQASMSSSINLDDRTGQSPKFGFLSLQARNKFWSFIYPQKCFGKTQRLC
jgi:hypothetical protein